MAKAVAAHRLLLENYPYCLHIETQYGDMDVHGHVNNLAIGRFFESARARFQMQIFSANRLFKRDADYSMMLVENNMRFLAECNFPAPVEVGTGLGHIGNSSYLFEHALFQNGKCVGLCEAVMVLARDAKPIALPADVRERMQPMLIKNSPL